MPLAGEKTRPLALPTACDGMRPAISPFTEEVRTMSSDLEPLMKMREGCTVVTRDDGQTMSEWLVAHTAPQASRVSGHGVVLHR
ncbi:predicted protein [Chaetomium globosum CBS 148.51]|uniref:Uncharacterized protein n=1 Tax=Chaetomium globosum (strain ATCC 6205 / CBS 148.51 / DSM 1962 / NBRC 6347 / NRRL 1970) TaxID=306901 RepID=Q2GNT6_CHAGB|nr:uncharacterized protein CHGG_10368 [Chaetomium globosum CBS 148.51]EAQ83964.1 predicted protein [Chaetomium globosum CBS 148.51]